jgi:hypothetical protein
LARWSELRGSRAASPGRLVWLFQLTSIPCDDVGFKVRGVSTPPPDRDGCDEYHLFDAQSGAQVAGLGTTAGAAVLRPP